VGDAASVAMLVERVMGGGVILHLVDVAPDARGRVRSRSYAIGLQPALWGGTDLVRMRGRRGHLRRPRLLATHHVTEAELRRAVAGVVRLRLRHGYLLALGAL
jgi:hypothetical protein